MEKKYFMGGDISKLTIDIALLSEEGVLLQTQISNDKEGFCKLIRTLNKKGIQSDMLLICIENTGMYGQKFAEYLFENGYDLWIESAVQIKYSIGVTRGKTDQLDAYRIAEYAKRHLDKAKLFKGSNKTLEMMRDLLGTRDRLKKQLKGLQQQTKELKEQNFLDRAKMLNEILMQPIASIKKAIKEIEMKLQALVEADENISKVFDYATSVRSVGFITACYLIVHTECFEKFNSVKQLSTYCGVAPFPRQSGSSIRSRTQVSHMANKKLKTILHMCAVSSIKNNKEMKAYFERKVKEGKNKMLVLNNIRNKLLKRIWSCVKGQYYYVEEAMPKIVA